MERIDKILQHELYKEYVGKIELAERDREFCKHDMVHFLDVCRLAMILYLKEQADAKDIKEEWIYATGLLHDIGRWQEYEEGIRQFNAEIARLKAKDAKENAIEIQKLELQKASLAEEKRQFDLQYKQSTVNKSSGGGGGKTTKSGGGGSSGGGGGGTRSTVKKDTNNETANTVRHEVSRIELNAGHGGVRPHTDAGEGAVDRCG